MSNCNEYISADDLKTGKQAINHITHVSKSVDATGAPALEVTDDIGGTPVTNKTLDGLFSDIGFKPVNGSFEDGGTVVNRWDVLLYENEGSFYQWMGTLPKVVTAGSTPVSAGGISPTGWIDQTDLTLRSTLQNEDGFKLIGKAPSFAALRMITPGQAGQRILLASYYANGRTGGGEFIARSTVPLSVVPSDDGGVIALVNSNWFWERVDQNNVTVDGFGAKSYVVPADETIPVGVVSSSDAFQRMFDSIHKITVEDGNTIGYMIDAPIRLFGKQRWDVDLKNAVIVKNTTTKTGLADYIPMAGAYVEGNVNCVFMVGGTTCRYWEFTGGYIDCHLAPSGDRPVGIYIAETVGYKIERVLTRGCKNGLWVKSGWLAEINLCRFSENTDHGVYYDSNRFTSTGTSAGRGQTATSLHISSSYVAQAVKDGWHMESCQYMNFQSSAMDGAGSVTGGSSYYFDACDVTGDIGSETPSSSASAYLTLVGGTATLSMNTYDTVTTSNPVILASGGAIATIPLSARTQRTRLCTITGTGCFIRIPLLSFYNGTTTVPASSLVDPGSFLEVLAGRDTKGTLNYTDGKVQRSNPYTAAYNSRPSELTPFTTKEARFGVAAGTTTVNIPLADIVTIFPNFNRGSNTFIEWLQISTRNGTGITYGAIVACTAGAIIGSKVDSQISTGNGSAAAVITGFSVSGSNLVITYTSAIATDSIIILKPV